MSQGIWIAILVPLMAFDCWVIFGRGAERLEQSIFGELFVGFLGDWSADQIRLFAWIGLIGKVILLGLGLVYPAFRFW